MIQCFGALLADMALPLPLAAMLWQIDSGAAHVALCADFDAKGRLLVKGSPIYVLNERRQISASG